MTFRVVDILGFMYINTAKSPNVLLHKPTESLHAQVLTKLF